MNNHIRATFLALIILQAIHSVEEFIFRFYERFPPMRFIYQDALYLARPAFVIANAFLILFGLFCFYYWLQPARKGGRTVVWVWIIIESFNVIAHFTWAVLIRAYNPGLLTAILFVPVLIYLSYLARSARQRSAE